MSVHDDIELWFAVHPDGPATDERQLLNDAADEIERLCTELYDVAGLSEFRAQEIERLRAVVVVYKEESAACGPAMDQLAECRRLLREACIAWKNAHDYSGDGRLRLIPVFQVWYEAAAAAGGGG